MPYSETYIGTTDGTTGNEVVDTAELLPVGYPELAAAYMREIGDGGAADRIGTTISPPTFSARIKPPAKVGGLDYLIYAQYIHSIQRGSYFFQDLATVPLADTLDVPHGLGEVPDFVFVGLRANPGIASTFNWAVTVIDDINISIENWSAVAEITLTLFALTAHSILADLIVGPFDMTIAGLAEVDQAHGLVWPGSGTAIIPGVVSAFPYAAGGVVEPTGGPIMTNIPDDTEWHFGGNDATADLILRTYGMYPHSIQQ